jgi:hypothetical protein
MEVSMSWHDPARLETEADSALRNELRGLLGMTAAPANYFESEPSPELVRLADALKCEAQRRNHLARKRSSWMLMAAALPFALAMGGMGVWGLSQKHKADHLAAAVAHQEAEIQQLAAAQQHPAPQSPGAEAQQLRVHAPAPKGQPSQVLLLGEATPRTKPKELVEPVERTPQTTITDTQRVKSH